MRDTISILFRGNSLDRLPPQRLVSGDSPRANRFTSPQVNTSRTELVPKAPIPEYKHKPFYAHVADNFEVRGSREDEIRFRVGRFTDFLFSEDLRPSEENYSHPINIKYDNSLNHIHKQICKGLHLCSERKEGDIERVDSTYLFVQDGALCSAYATWQFLYSALWEHLDDWTRTFLNSLIQYQESLRLHAHRRPSRFVRTKVLNARPEIMMTYYADSDDNVERKELMADIRQHKANLADKEDEKEMKMLHTKTIKIKQLDIEWEKSIKQVPWYSSFTRLLRAHLTCLNVRVISPNPDKSSPLEPNLVLQSGFNILSLPIDELVKNKNDTWEVAVSTMQKFTKFFDDADKGIVKGCCVRCVITDAPEYDHFITYIQSDASNVEASEDAAIVGMWYDNGKGGTKTENFTDLRYYKLGGTITDLHIIIYKRSSGEAV